MSIFGPLATNSSKETVPLRAGAPLAPGTANVDKENIDHRRPNNMIQGPRKKRKASMPLRLKPATQDQYTKRLAALHDIRDILQSNSKPPACGNDAYQLRLPQVIVVGSQSDGKSSLLSCLTDIDFPEKSGICTKAPIVVECTYDASLGSNQYCVRDPSSNEYVSCDATSVAKRISDIQDVALRGCNGQEFKVSKDEIRVRVSGPEQMDIIIIDLPGIITNGDGQEETKELIRQYGEPDETLILLVTKAETDDELLPALDLAKEVDPNEERTLRVLTKFDQFGNPDAKGRAIRLIKPGSVATDHYERSVWGLEPHAVVCRSQMENGSMAYCVKKEIEVLDTLPERYVGVAALKRRLPAIFSHLVDVNLPKLHEATASHLHNAKSRLACIGWEPSDPTLVVMKCREKLLRSQNEFEAAISREFQTFHEQIHATGVRVTKEFTDENYTPNIFHVSFFYGEEAMMKSMDQIVGWWTPITSKYIDSVEHVLSNSLECDAVASRNLANYLEGKWAEYYRDLCADFRLKCTNLLGKEKKLGTVNHYLRDKYQEEILLPEELIKKVCSEVELSDASGFVNRSAVANMLETTLLNMRRDYACEYGRKTLDEQQKHRVFAAVKALWHVEKKTFSDNIMKETRDDVIYGRKKWAETELHIMLPELREQAVENNEIVSERELLKGIVECMTQIQKKLQDLRSL